MPIKNDALDLSVTAVGKISNRRIDVVGCIEAIFFTGRDDEDLFA